MTYYHIFTSILQQNSIKICIYGYHMENIKNYKFSVKKRVPLHERLPNYKNILFTKILSKNNNNNENLTCKTCGNTIEK